MLSKYTNGLEWIPMSKGYHMTCANGNLEHLLSPTTLLASMCPILDEVLRLLSFMWSESYSSHNENSIH